MDPIYNMKKGIYDYLMSIKKDPKLIEELKVANSLYIEILKLNDDASIKDYYKKFYDICINHSEYKEYLDLSKKLNSVTDKELRHKIHDRLELLARRINARHRVLGFLDEYVNGKRVKQTPKQEIKSEVKPQVKQEVKPEVKPQTQKPTPKVEEKVKPEVKEKGVTNNVMDQFLHNSEIIVSLLDRYNSLDKSTSEAKKERAKINQILDDRQNTLMANFGADVMVNLSVVESLEERMSRLPKYPNNKVMVYDSRSFNLKIRDVLSKINDFDFNGINSRYFTKDNSKSDGVNESKLFKEREKLVTEYHNMIKSLYGKDKVEFEGLDGVTFDDIIPMLSTCNLEGGFKTFKSSFKGRKIGSEEITKEMYEDRFKKLDLYIKLLCTINEEEINKKGGQVSVTNHQKTREDLLKEIEKEYTKMINQIKNRSKSQSETVGDRVVHR